VASASGKSLAGGNAPETFWERGKLATIENEKNPV